MKNLLYGLYERRLQRALRGGILPCHVAVILDGNRRWAKAVGSTPSEGHQEGANRITDLLGWSEEMDVQVVTLWMLSTDNLLRDQGELAELLEIITSTVEKLSAQERWNIRIVGDLSLVPENFSKRLVAASGGNGMVVNVAVGYGGRQEVVEAVRAFLRSADEKGRSLGDVATELSDESISEHLYTRGLPDPDLVIRTSGEQRLSGFMIWQSAHSEYYFCETYWPDFRRVDFLRALRSYTQRERRRGL